MTGPLCGLPHYQYTESHCTEPADHYQRDRDPHAGPHIINGQHCGGLAWDEPKGSHMIQPGQTYRSLDPRGGPRIRIVAYTPGCNRVDAVDATDGKRPRSILVTALHATAATKTGKPRRTGYVLEQP